MISYNLRKCDYDKTKYAHGFSVLNTNEIIKISVMMARYVWSPIVWKNGHRLNENFHRADWIALDFDEGLTLIEAKENIFADRVCIIGTTKSHQKPKNGIICDRFRVMLKLQLPITNAVAYKAQIQNHVDNYGCDSAAKDGARFFWPCRDIVVVSPEGELEEVLPTPSDPTKYNHDYIGQVQKDFLENGKMKSIQGWLARFLSDGEIPDWAGGRHSICHKAATKLLVRGLEPEEVVEHIWNAPFDKDMKGGDGKGYTKEELEKSVESALKWLKKELAKEDCEKDARKRREHTKQWLKSN